MDSASARIAGAARLVSWIIWALAPKLDSPPIKALGGRLRHGNNNLMCRSRENGNPFGGSTCSYRKLDFRFHGNDSRLCRSRGIGNPCGVSSRQNRKLDFRCHGNDSRLCRSREIGNPFGPYSVSPSYKSCQCGLLAWISSIFQERFHFLICFSLVMAAVTSS